MDNHKTDLTYRQLSDQKFSESLTTATNAAVQVVAGMKAGGYEAGFQKKFVEVLEGNPMINVVGLLSPEAEPYP